MFGRKKDEQTIESLNEAARPGQDAVDAERRQGAKNRPTPTRREAQAARQRPLVPVDRKAAKSQSRAKERSERNRMREGMYAGQQWALPARDRGPQRAFIRDIVDARWNLSEFLLPVMVVGLPISLIPNRSAVLVGYVIVYGAVLLAVLDGFFLWAAVKKRVRTKFDTDPQKGSLWYVISRAMQIRPGRVPRPQVKRRQYPT